MSDEMVDFHLALLSRQARALAWGNASAEDRADVADTIDDLLDERGA